MIYDYFKALDDRLLRTLSYGSKEERSMKKRTGEMINKNYDVRIGPKYEEILEKIFETCLKGKL
jgi:hypothetical protein